MGEAQVCANISDNTNMTVIPLDGTNLAIGFDRPNESYYVLRAGVPVARSGSYSVANDICWSLFEEAIGIE